MVEQPLEGMGQHFIRAIADEDMVGGHVMRVRDGGAQRMGRGVGIEAQRIVRRGPDGVERPG